MAVIDEDTRRAIVAEIVAATRTKRKQPYQFDLEDYVAQAPDISRQRAYDSLMKLARDGTLQTELVTFNSKQVRVWWRVCDEPG